MLQVLKRFGFQIRGQVSSHVSLVRLQGNWCVTVPLPSGGLPPGTFHRLLREAGITLAKFRQLLRGQR
ncbi:MAG: toxin HicA [Candidatus Fervidibacterota bacterium]